MGFIGDAKEESPINMILELCQAKEEGTQKLYVWAARKISKVKPYEIQHPK